MNRQTQQGRVSLPAMAPPKRYRVTFQDDSTWEGTRRELFEENPTWWQYAVEIVEPVQDWHNSAATVFVNGDGDVTPLDDLDYRDADGRKSLTPRSSINYQTTSGQRVRTEWRPGQVVQRRKSAQQPRDTEEGVPAARQKKRRSWVRRVHPLAWLGIGMLVMIGLWQGLTALGSWWSLHNDDVTYGRPRTAQYDVVVGHDDSPTNKTHIIALNLNHVVV